MYNVYTVDTMQWYKSMLYIHNTMQWYKSMLYIHDYTYYLVHVRNGTRRLHNVLICDIIYSNIVNRNDDVLLTTSLVWLSSLHIQTQHIYVYVYCDKATEVRP